MIGIYIFLAFYVVAVSPFLLCCNFIGNSPSLGMLTDPLRMIGLKPLKNLNFKEHGPDRAFGLFAISSTS